ncbi:MAG: hypothetical protein KGL48_01280 [Sphingomonadales bacterium]|nr:hypothetical protein [Sphingomonadales bacterium]MDE2567917.1 hypothetical protein [Sphingomonadales bacterium]
MIDKFTILVPHVLMAIAIWRLLARQDLDHDPNFPDPEPIQPPKRRRRRDA